MTASTLQLSLRDEHDTRRLGRLIGERAPLPLVIGLSGDLGAGKTTFSQAVGQAFGVAEPMPSPTFTLINEYATARGRLYHLDLYRLGDLDELLELGIEDTLAEPELLMLVEWFDRFADWPAGPPLLRIELAHLPQGRSARLLLPPELADLAASLEDAWKN